MVCILFPMPIHGSALPNVYDNLHIGLVATLRSHVSATRLAIAYVTAALEPLHKPQTHHNLETAYYHNGRYCSNNNNKLVVGVDSAELAMGLSPGFPACFLVRGIRYADIGNAATADADEVIQLKVNSPVPGNRNTSDYSGGKMEPTSFVARLQIIRPGVIVCSAWNQWAPVHSGWM